MVDNKENQYNGIENDYDDQANSAVVYERTRIKPLAEQREEVQKKTFTNWVNSHLKRNKHVDKADLVLDLFNDLRDGKVLINLLETLSGDKLPRPEKGKMRIHCLENVAKCIHFLLSQHVYLENMGSHDIVDGNATLTLGLIWTIILRYQIQDIQFDDAVDSGTKTPKDALLLWCQMKTAQYPNVNIRNFTNSWKDGLAFNALLHKHKPEVVDFMTMTKERPMENMNTAFDLFEREFDVPKLMDPSDILVDQPEEKSIITYVAMIYDKVNKSKETTVQGKRAGKIIDLAIEIDKMQELYESLCSDLLEWVKKKIHWMKTEPMKQSLPEVIDQLEEFKQYRLQEKPPKFETRGQLEMQFFEIQSRLMAAKRKLFMPKEGLLISDINRAWEDLEKVEHEMEMRLYEELIKQQRLQQLGDRFNRKALMRESWLADNDNLVHQDIFGDDLVTVDAAIKKHEALEGDIFAHQERIDMLGYIVDELDQENYYKIDEIRTRYDNIVELWRKLLEDLQNRRDKLDNCREVQLILQERAYIMELINEFIERFNSSDCGKHLIGVESLIERHKILVGDSKNIEPKIKDICDRIANFDLEEAGLDPEKVQEKLDRLKEIHEQLLLSSDHRESELQKTRSVWEYIENLDNFKEWIKELNQLMLNPDLGHDLNSVERLIRKHNQLISDSKLRKDLILDEIDVGIDKIKQEHDSPERKELLDSNIRELKDLLDILERNTETRTENLNNALLYHQLLTDVEYTDTLILEEIRIFENADVGDKLILTEFYLKKYEEQMIQVDDLEKTLSELLYRYNDLEKNALGQEKMEKLETSRNTMERDFEKLKEQAQKRYELLKKSMDKFLAFKDMYTIETWITAKEKFLLTLETTDEIDELNVIKHRFDCFEDEMKNNAQNVENINELCKNLIHDQVPDSPLIAEKIDRLNKDWNELADLDEAKKRELQMAQDYGQFLIECEATCQWIDEKKKLLEWSDDLRDDLDGIMQLQRRLGSLERDVLALEAKVQFLNDKVPEMKEHKPLEHDKIEDAISKVNDEWEKLKIMLQDRDEKLHSSGQLQKFLQDLDAFNVWLSNVQTQVATLDIPTNLPDAEKNMLNHEKVLEDVKLWEPEFHRLLDFGREVTDKKDEPQYILFSQRLDALEKGWDSLQEMCEDKTDSLRQSIDAQTFLRDSAQVDSILSRQETFLSNYENPVTLEASQNCEREFDKFKDSVSANKPRIESTVNFGQSLLPTNALSEKIGNKCDQILERSKAIDDKIQDRDKQIKDNLKLIIYLEDVLDLEEWISEKMIMGADTNYRELKDVSSRYNRFKDFEQQIDQNENRLNDVVQKGGDLIESNPEYEATIQPKIESLQAQWDNLKESAQTRSKEIEEANREAIFQENVVSTMDWITQIESQIVTSEEVTEELGLTELEQEMTKQDERDRQLQAKKKILQDMETQAEKLRHQYPDRHQEFEEIQEQVRVKLTQAEAPLISRRNEISQKKRVRQFLRDIDDELDWIQQKSDVLSQLNRNEVPDSLQICQQKQRRLHTMQNEVKNHEPRINQIVEEGQCLINEGSPKSLEFETKIDELQEKWEGLDQDLDACEALLKSHQRVCEYLFDANNCREWIEEREIDLLKDEKVRDLDSARNSQRKNDDIIRVIGDYEEMINELNDRHNDIINDELEGADKVKNEQIRLDANYKNLLSLAGDRKDRIADLISLYALLIKIQDLEEWIAERTIVACNNEAGKDLEHCTLLRDRFSEFARETNELGSPRVSRADQLCDNLIDQGHQEAAEIARWKDLINEAWSDLLELIETRIQLLKNVWDFYKFMSDSAELIELLQSKIHMIPETVGRDAKSVAAYLRRHTTFTEEVERMRPQIQQQLNVVDHLRELYSGEKESELMQRRQQLEEVWKRLLFAISEHHDMLVDTNDFYRFLSMVRELLDWYQQMHAEMNKQDKPRDCCGVEIIIINHRSLRAEIDSRDENYSVCLGLGRTLINNRHRNRNDIRGKCRDVVVKHHQVVELWRERKDYLDLILEVYQFAREAAVAEAWLIAQEPQVHNQFYGDDLSQTLALLQKHEALERNLTVQYDRFESLRRRTRMELESEQPDAEQQRDIQRQQKLQGLLHEFQTPPPTPTPEPRTKKLVEASRPISEPRQQDGAEAEIQDDLIHPVFSATAAAQPAASRPKSQESSLPSQLPPVQPKSGMLSRKHEWEIAGVKKASGRGWHDLFCVLDSGFGSQLKWYKDEKKYRSDPDTGTYKSETPMKLSGAQASPAVEYKKKGHTIRLRLEDGREFLLQAKSDDDMRQWLEVINQAASNPGSPSGPAYSTLPLSPKQPTSSTKDTGGKHKIATLGRKK